MIKPKFEYRPFPKQHIFHGCPADDVLYGGAAGGGKSASLVMDARHYAIKYPNSRLILFRRTFAELEASLINEMEQFYTANDGAFNDGKKEFNFFNGSKIYFRYLENENDVKRYQGPSYGYIGFDELTHFSRRQFDFMKSRLRVSADQPTFMRCTSNPDPYNIENNEWVKQYFVSGATPNTIRKDSNGLTRCFIPANVYDNPILMKNDPKYLKRLENLPELERQAFLYGNWNVKLQGLIYANFTDEHIKEIDVPAFWTRICGIDFGFTNPTAMVFLATDGDMFYIFDEHYQPGMHLSEIRDRLKMSALSNVFGDPSEAGTIDELKNSGVPIDKADNEVLAGIFFLRQLIQDKKLIVSPRCTNVLGEINKYSWDKDKARPIKAFDHAMDAMRYGVMSSRQKLNFAAFDHDSVEMGTTGRLESDLL